MHLSIFPKQNSNTQSQKIKVIAKKDLIYSFIKHGEDKFNFYEKNTIQFAGANFEIMNKVFNQLKLPYLFEIVPEENIEEMLKSGKADVALSLLKSKKTLEFADFSNVPLFTKNFVFFGRAKEVKSTTMTYENILEHNYKIGISAGVKYPQEFWKWFPYENKVLNSHLIEFEGLQENIQALKNNEIDLFVAEIDFTNSALKSLRQNKYIQQYKNILFFKNFYCAFSKKSKLKEILNIKKQVQRSLYKMQESNQIKEINDFWMHNNAANSLRTIYEK